MDFKIFGAFLGGFGAGIAVTRLVLKRKYDDILDEEVERIQNDYENRLNEGVDKEIAKEMAQKYTQEEDSEAKKEPKTTKIDSLTGTKRSPVKTKPTDYSKKSTKKTKTSPNGVRITDLEEYSDNPNDCELVSYSYFKVDKVFVDLEYDEVDLNIASEIGDEILEGHTDVDALYLALDDSNKLLELVIHDTSYAEWMMEDHE